MWRPYQIASVIRCSAPALPRAPRRHADRRPREWRFDCRGRQPRPCRRSSGRSPCSHRADWWDWGCLSGCLSQRTSNTGPTKKCSWIARLPTMACARVATRSGAIFRRSLCGWPLHVLPPSCDRVNPVSAGSGTAAASWTGLPAGSGADADPRWVSSSYINRRSSMTRVRIDASSRRVDGSPRCRGRAWPEHLDRTRRAAATAGGPTAHHGGGLDHRQLAVHDARQDPRPSLLPRCHRARRLDSPRLTDSRSS